MKAKNATPKVLVTGANGYIGSHMLNKLINCNYDVVALVRSLDSLKEQKEIVPYLYQLDGVICQEAFDGVNAIIHLATFTGKRNAKKQNIELKAIKQLLEVANTAKVEKFIFVSSQSAQPDSPTFYGRDKWLLEQEVKKQGGIIVRPGLVYGGDDERALFGTLCKLVNKFPVVPKFIPAPVVQPVHVDDLCLALFNIVNNPIDRFEYNIAALNSLTFSKFLEGLAWYRYNKYLWSIPFPIFLISLMSQLLKFFPFNKLIDKERVDGLLALSKMDTRKSLDALNLTLRPLAEGLTKKSNINSQLLIEGGALIHYVSGVKPNKWNVRKYAYMIKQIRASQPMAIRYSFLKFPALLRWVDPKWTIIPIDENSKNELKWRMNAALVISEATSDTSPMFTIFSSKQIVSSTISLTKDILIEIPLLFIKIIFKLLIGLRLMKNFKVTL